MKNEKGFSLVELLIVVAIIAIIAAIAVPSLLTARMASNEASALQGLRTIGSAEIAFAATQNQQYTNMTSLVGGNYLDSRFSTATTGYINGYTYTADCGATITGAPVTTALTPPTNFGVLATPNTGLGRFTYGIAPDQVVRFEATSTAFPTGSSAGSPIGKTS